MNEIDDKQLDELIAEALDREAMSEQICKGVERQLHKERRRVVWRKWGPILLFPIFVPVVFCFCLRMYLNIYHAGLLHSGSIACLFFPVAGLSLGLHLAISEFHKGGLHV